MGVNFAGALVLFIAVSYIHAQEYVVLGETDLDQWDDDQNQIFLDQANHVIHRRDIETDIEGSGNGEPEQAVAPPQESTNNKTSIDQENKEPPVADKLAEEVPQEANVKIQISSFGELNLDPDAKEAPKPNETKTEPEVLSVDSVQQETKTDTPSSVQKSGVGDNLPASVEPPQPEPQDVQPVAQVADAIAATTLKPDVVDKDKPVEVANSTEKSDVANEELGKIAIEVANSTEKSNVANEELGKIAIEVANPTEKSDVPVLSPLVHQLIPGEASPGIAESTEKSKEDLPQRTVVPATKTDSPIVPEKEAGSADTENKAKEGLKVTPQALPGVLAEDDSVKDKESEQVNAQQSGNAVMFKVASSGVASQVEGSDSDKALQGMAENAKISNEPTEPATGESAKNVTKAGKDTTILVVLFVVVIAIGGAAFTHNYIKKRKQNASTNEDLVNGIRRSLQNLTSSNGKNTTDVEQGTEMKPLMKENSPTLTKVYTDSKKEVPA